MSKAKLPDDSDQNAEANALALENENLQLEIELLGSQQATAAAQALVSSYGLTETEILGRAAEAKFIADASALEAEIYERAKAKQAKSEVMA